MKEELKELAQKEGATLVGICEIKGNIRQGRHRGLPLQIDSSIENVCKKLPYGISIGYRLSECVLRTVKDSPTLIYKHHYKTVNWLLDQIAAKIVNFIQNTGSPGRGKLALAIPASQTIDWENQAGHLSHILIARESGLGWIGRSGLLVNPVYGAGLRYATVLTDMELEPDKPINGDCGECEKCINACPAGAISKVDGSGDPSLPGLGSYDKNKCINKLKNFASIKGIGVYICGVCVAVCNRSVKYAS